MEDADVKMLVFLIWFSVRKWE